MPLVLPVAAAVTAALPLAAAVSVGLVGLGASGIDAANAVTKVTPTGLSYINHAAGVRALFPPGWKLDAKPREIEAQNPTGSCRVLVLREYQLKSPQGYMNSVDAQISKKEGFSVHDHSAGTLDGRPSAEMVVSVGTTVTEHMACARVRRSLYSLIAIGRDDDFTCPGQLQFIRANLHLGR